MRVLSSAAFLFIVTFVYHAIDCTTGTVVDVSPVGDPIDVWSSVHTLHKCGIIDVPDIPARIYAQGKDKVHMIEGSTHFYPMSGPSIFNFTRGCTPAWNMTGNPDPAMFSGDEFLDSAIAFANGTIVSLIHTEFPGNLYGNCSDGLSYPYCFTVTIGLAISHDWGQTWNHARPPPYHLVAAVPYVYNETQLAYGWGDPSNIVLDPNDGFYYVAMWNKNQVGLQKPGICIARTKNLMDPSSWRGWDGEDFTTSFVSPYDLDPQASKKPHICAPVENLPPLCGAFSLVWSVYLEKFVATLGCFEEMLKSFYLSTSDDLIHWSPIQPFYSADKVPANVKKMITSIAYPAFLDPAAPDKYSDINYYTIGQEPYLYWVSLGHSPYTDGRHLWATPMKFSIDVRSNVRETATE
jgi:hypothetical protein